KGSRPASTRRPRNRPHTPAARAPVGDVGDVRLVLGGGRLGGGRRRCHQTEQELALTGEQLVGEVERQGDDVGGRGKAGAGEAVDTRKRHRGELLDGRAQRLGTAEDGRLHRLDGVEHLLLGSGGEALHVGGHGSSKGGGAVRCYANYSLLTLALSRA